MTTGVSLNVTVVLTGRGPDSANSLRTSLLMSTGIRCGTTPLPLSAPGRALMFSGLGLPSLESVSKTTFFLLPRLLLLFLSLLVTSGRFLVELRKVTR